MPAKHFDKTEEQTLADGESMTITIGSGIDGRAVVQIDDGTTDGQPATYDLIARRYNPALADWMYFDELSGAQYRAVEDPLSEDRQQYELTNRSGANATYRMRVVGIGGGR